MWTGAPPRGMSPRVTTPRGATRTLSVEEAAQRLGISRGYAYELARAGQLPGVIRLGRVLRVSTAVLDRVLGIEEAGSRLLTELGA